MAFALAIVKAIIEIALMALIGQLVLGIFLRGRGDENFVYKLFKVVASPFTRIARIVSPRVVLDRHIPLVTLLLLAFAWIFVLLQLRSSCLQEPTQTACVNLGSTEKQ